MERSAVWMRTSGMTAVAVLDEQERFDGLGRLVRQVMEVAVKPRRKSGTLFMDRATGVGGDGVGVCDPLTPDSLRSSRPSPLKRGEGRIGGGLRLRHWWASHQWHTRARGGDMGTGETRGWSVVGLVVQLWYKM